MRMRGLVVLVLAGLCLTCQSTDSVTGGACGGGQVCGFIDHKYFSTFYCPPNPPFPSGSFGYSWRDPNHCVEECNSASSWGCDTSSCAAGCTVDHGTGQWLPCNEASGGVPRSNGCFLSGSGVNGETVPCECR